jgi:hypothetical protein
MTDTTHTHLSIIAPYLSGSSCRQLKAERCIYNPPLGKRDSKRELYSMSAYLRTDVRSFKRDSMCTR